MRKPALALIVFSACLCADPVSPAAQKAVASAEEQWRQAVLHGDRSTLTNLVADDITYTHSSSMTQTKEQFIDSVVSGSTKYQQFEFKTTQMRQYGNTVISIHEAVITTGTTGMSHLYLTHIWAERKGHWQLVSRQATKIPEPAK